MMHRLFSDEERKWIYTRELGWPIKEGCPEDIRESIEKKKKDIDKQARWVKEGVAK